VFAYKVSAHDLSKVCQPRLTHMHLEQITSHRYIAIKIKLFFNVVHEPRIHYEFSGRNSLYIQDNGYYLTTNIRLYHWIYLRYGEVRTVRQIWIIQGLVQTTRKQLIKINYALKCH